jgi:hypothetical protein
MMKCQGCCQESYQIHGYIDADGFYRESVR